MAKLLDRPKIAAVLVAGLMLTSATSVLADRAERNQLNCSSYTSQATQLVQRNKELNCGFAGQRWSPVAQSHFNWCSTPGITARDLAHENRMRQAALNSCQSKGQKRTKVKVICEEYAKRAVRQSVKNRNDLCGYTGGQWSTNPMLHRSWCLRAGPKAVLRADELRQKLLKRCRTLNA